MTTRVVWEYLLVPEMQRRALDAASVRALSCEQLISIGGGEKLPAITLTVGLGLLEWN